MNLESNIRGLCDKYGLDYVGFLADMGIDSPLELTVADLEIICEEYGADLSALLFNRPFKTNHLKDKLAKIKLLVIDVDGVMTDGGMYFTESGDQFKKFNTKDGMAIIHLTKNDFQVAIISSGFKGEAVQRRAEMLGIQNCSVSREPKLNTLQNICDDLGLSFENVAMIGDDINDAEVMKAIGFSACPSDAMNEIKSIVDVVLNTAGGRGCVRELIDLYILKEPLKK